MEDAYTTPEITGAYKGYEDAANKAIEYQDAASQLPDKLKQAINEKLDYNRDLIEQKNKLAVDYFNAPSEARAKYADQSSPNAIWNPMQAENLVSQYRNQAWQPYQTASDVLKARQGSIADIISTASTAFSNQASVAMERAKLARQKWEDLFGVAKQKVSDKKGSGGGSDFGSVLAGILGKETTATENAAPTEPQPTIDMSTANPAVHWRSPGGQWEWNQQYATWVPIGADVVE